MKKHILLLTSLIVCLFQSCSNEDISSYETDNGMTRAMPKSIVHQMNASNVMSAAGVNHNLALEQVISELNSMEASLDGGELGEEVCDSIARDILYKEYRKLKKPGPAIQPDFTKIEFDEELDDLCKHIKRRPGESALISLEMEDSLNAESLALLFELEDILGDNGYDLESRLISIQKLESKIKAKVTDDGDRMALFGASSVATNTLMHWENFDEFMPSDYKIATQSKEIDWGEVINADVHAAVTQTIKGAVKALVLGGSVTVTAFAAKVGICAAYKSYKEYRHQVTLLKNNFKGHK